MNLMAKELYLREANMWGRSISLIWKDRVGENSSMTVANVSATDNGYPTTDNGFPTTDKQSSATKDERILRLLAQLGDLHNDSKKNIEFVLKELLADCSVTADAIAKKSGSSSRTIQRTIMTLTKAGIVRRIGPDKGGHWEVME